jgi:molybdopterin molybdotransferase
MMGIMNNNMISVKEAKAIILDNVQQLAPVIVPIALAGGYTLAEDVYATTDIPAFNQSSMDGYAFRFSDWSAGSALIIDGEIPAGAADTHSLSAKQAMRIFTGAAVPPGADTVVMQEKVIVANNTLRLQDEQLKAGNNVRAKGSEIKAGSRALAKKSFLSPAAIGFLAGIGLHALPVYPTPSVCIIVTGKELQQPGEPLQYGQVYESNSFALRTALRQLQINDAAVVWADDDLTILKTILEQALQQHDVVLLTGGVSVGDYDFVLEAAGLCGVTKLFHKIKQRPGKPLFFGKKDNKVVFGLPGNPSSVLTCFYEYVLPALDQMTMQSNSLKVLQLPLLKDYKKLPGLAHFLKGYYDGSKVEPLNAQESYRLHSFARANCLICLEEERGDYKEGEVVEVHLLG